MTTVLEAFGLGRRYGDRVALREVSFELAAGELVALLGANGAGKTTLLSTLAGVAAPDTGTIRAEGRIAWVPQGTAIYGKLTVSENLRLFATLERVADPEAAVEAMLDQTGLRARADDQVATLSGGNRQRVNVAIGLLAAPSVLLLDEPSAALDPRQRERLWAFVSALAQRGTAVLYSTHEVADAARHASRVLVLAEGELVFAGPPDGLGPGRDLEAAFLALLARRGG